jgi:hypothetical protein
LPFSGLRGNGFGSFNRPVTRDEHKAILAFIEQTVGGELPPMDVEADAIIRALFKLNPDAAYRMTMLAMSLSTVALNPKPECLPRHKNWLAALFERREAVSVREGPAVL